MPSLPAPRALSLAHGVMTESHVAWSTRVCMHDPPVHTHRIRAMTTQCPSSLKWTSFA